MTALLNEQHYGAATYMTKQELYATYPEGTQDRQTRKHLWTPPAPTESPSPAASYGAPRRSSTACTPRPRRMSWRSHTTPRSSRSARSWSSRPVTELVDEARVRKTPNAAVLIYEQADGLFHARGTAQPDC